MKLFGILTVFLLAFATLTLAAPVAEITADPLTGDAPLDVAFEATEDVNATSYVWDFGDGTADTGRTL